MTGLRDSDPETCILCGSGTVPRLSGRMAPNLAEYGTRQCLSCGLEFIDPVPSTETLFSIYNGEYRLHQHDNETMSNPMLGNRLGQRIRSAGRRLLLSIYERRFGRPIAKRLPGGSGRVLEIGFGAGATLERLYAQGWNVTGLEVAEGPVLSARERMPAGTFLRGTIDEKISSVGVFDLILLYHVLEHLDDPVGALMLMRQSLDDHGTLVVAVPNRDSLTRRLFGARWYGYRHPEHLLQLNARFGWPLRRQVCGSGPFVRNRISLHLATRLPTSSTRPGVEPY